MKLGYYPGCALEGSANDYALATERVMKELDVELVPVRDWNCCGASAAHSTNHKLSIALPYRNLAIAKEQGLAEIFAPCPFCSKTLINTGHEIAENHALNDQMKSATGLSYDNSVKIINSVAIFNRLTDLITPKLNPERLKNLKVACYYGCLLVRPPKVLKYDDPEQPTSMDEIVKKIGAEPVDWEYKIECCGGGFTVCNEDAVLELSNKILDDAKANNAEAIIVACQMCQFNLDMRQSAIETKYGLTYNMPIIYLPQLIGLAMGIEPKELGLNLHFVDTAQVIGQLGNQEMEIRKSEN
ncbi:MAG: CoB--CoM heterodisulfide reductase iron-sulfur subunit B family protein [Planctomycetes bacterium]|nr:CoB--CoM heterodisulfide reductase iron-sulfur subunit B family protein [Planctomycetota bacterium]